MSALVEANYFWVVKFNLIMAKFGCLFQSGKKKIFQNCRKYDNNLNQSLSVRKSTLLMERTTSQGFMLTEIKLNKLFLLYVVCKQIL